MERKSQQNEEVSLSRFVQATNKYAEKTLSWARRNVLVGVVGVAATLGIYFYGSQGQEIPEKEMSAPKNEPSESESAKSKLPEISISSIHVSEIAMDIPAAFELGIEADGLTNLPVRDIDVVLDFGRAEINVCGYTPEAAVTNVVAEDKSHRRIEIEELHQEEKFYVRCLISSPVFSQVIINAGNIDSSVSMDFKQYRSRQRDGFDRLGFWTVIIRLAAIFFIVIFCVKISIWLFGD